MEAIGTLAGGIAHDFNNILTAILGYTELALDDICQDSHAWRYLHEVRKAGLRAKTLVQQILTFSRRTEQPRIPVQLPVLIEEALALLRASLPSTIEIHQAITKDVGPVLADPTQLHQVLLNLCANAAHAMRETGGRLEVRLEAVEVDEQVTAQHPELQPGPYVCITVTDTGHGMIPEVMERIFEPFSPPRRPERGQGWGWPSCTASSRTMGVLCWSPVSSARGPRSPSTFPAALTWDRTRPHRRGLFLRVPLLVQSVCSSSMTRRPWCILVRPYCSVSATRWWSAPAVPRLLKCSAPPQGFDLVITDQTMPHMTGERLAQALRRLRSDIPIILCTGFSHVMHAERAQELGIDAFLMKPLAMQDLAQTIQQVMAARHRPLS